MNERIEWTKECPICGEHLTVGVHENVTSGNIYVIVQCDKCDKYYFERSYPRKDVYALFGQYNNDIVTRLITHTCAEVEKNMSGQSDDTVEEQKTVPFYTALRACIEDGKSITRADWHGKGMKVWFVKPGTHNDKHLGYFTMRTPEGDNVIGWLASQTDLYSDKWIILDE